MVGAVGLCSHDIPNLAKLKIRSSTIGSLLVMISISETLDAIKAGAAQLTVGQHPYLQGYLPILALFRHLVKGEALVNGWINVGTEVITQNNVDEVYQRETDDAAQTKWYADYIAQNFADLEALAQPLPRK